MKYIKVSRFSFKVSHAKINKGLLYISALFGLIRMWSRIAGGTWEFVYGNAYTYTSIGSQWYGRSTLYAECSLIIFFIFNFKRCLKKKDFIWVLLCVGSFVLWTLIETLEGNGNEVLFGSIQSSICLIPLFFLFSSAPGVAESLKGLSGLLTIGYLGMSMYSSVTMYRTLGFGIDILSSPAKDSLSLAIIALWVYLFSDKYIENIKRKQVIKILLIVIAMICSIAILSRSWTIQCFLLLIGYLLISSEDKSKIKKILWLAVVLAIILVIVFWGFEEILNSLLLRKNEDTRSGQYEQFFSQISLYSLIIGKGMNASYRFNGQVYQYFDNQLIYTAFHYGIFSLISLFAFMLRALRFRIYDFSSEKVRKRYRGLKLVNVLFIMALLGLSVYLKYEWTVSFAVLLMFIGTYANIEWED